MTGAGSGLTSLEIASGLVFGVEPDEEPTRAAAAPTPRALLEAAMLAALQRPPCLVSFSGGRDSSCVLALATDLARREGLPLPVPATLRFPELAEADETSWQELVATALGLEHWIRLEPGDDLDVVGPVAARMLRRHGLLWPFNAYVHQPLIEAAHGGSLLTGVGGDELFEDVAVRNAVLSRRARPALRDALRLGLAVAPWRVRRAVFERRCPLRLPWLRPVAQQALDRAWATDAAHEPCRLDGRGRWLERQRRIRVAVRSYAALAGEDVLVAHPLATRGLASAIFQSAELAYADRAGRLKAVFGDLLPDDVYGRRSKASFNRALFTPTARELVDSWGGEELDEELVDADALRAVWHEDVPDGRSYLLLQSIWLAREASVRPTEASAGAVSSHPPATTSRGGV